MSCALGIGGPQRWKANPLGLKNTYILLNAILPSVCQISAWGYRGGSPAVRPSDPALCGSCPL